MKDIVYNVNTGDAVLTANGDFSTTENPSSQNGAICLTMRGQNLSKVSFGIGVEEVYDSTTAESTNEMNRWQEQIINDGGRALWSEVNGQFTWDVNYLSA